jgi:hypothetical protein
VPSGVKKHSNELGQKGQKFLEKKKNKSYDWKEKIHRIIGSN